MQKQQILERIKRLFFHFLVSFGLILSILSLFPVSPLPVTVYSKYASLGVAPETFYKLGVIYQEDGRRPMAINWWIEGSRYGNEQCKEKLREELPGWMYDIAMKVK